VDSLKLYAVHDNYANLMFLLTLGLQEVLVSLEATMEVEVGGDHLMLLPV
jgi:hypothetical protein